MMMEIAFNKIETESHMETFCKNLLVMVVLDQLTSIFKSNTISASIQLFEGIEG